MCKHWHYTCGLALALLLLGTLHANAVDQSYHKVRWVIDGDTIVLEDGRHIRYLGVNTPETRHEGRPSQPFGRAAQRYNQQLVGKQAVRLEFDQERHDRYGRWLAHVYRRDGLWVNRALLTKGLAIYLCTPKNRRYAQELLDAQRKAMRARAGLWQPGPTAAHWKGRYLGNRRSQRFHKPNCLFGRRTSRRNQVWFDSQWDAYHAGYAPGSKCLGRTPGALPETSD